MSACELAAAAEMLEGSPFRLHGRDPATGLDCIGVLAEALRAIGRTVSLPAAYSVRTREIPSLARIVRESGFAPVMGKIEPGDVLLVRIGPLQLHLLVAASDDRFVHAHAGLGRVVIGDLADGWKILGHWRIDAHIRG